MRDGAYITDGTKAIPLSSLRPEAWTPMDPEETFGGHPITVRAGQTQVPVLYRAIDIRAKAVAGMPFRLERGGQDITKDEAAQSLIKRLRALLYLTEASLCCYNAAYWELGANQFGFNLTPFFLVPSSIRPDIDPRTGLRGFYRTGGQGGSLPTRKVCYFWGPSIAVEEGPDPLAAPVAVVLTSAGLLYSLDRFAAGFFQRGAVKVTLLTVEGNPKPGEVEKLDAWWKRMVAGVKNAFGSVVVRAGVKPVVIGSSVQETSAPALTKLAREDVAAGMGVPMSLLFSNALAGGTADAERLNFYDFTVVPECEHVIDEPLNSQYLSRLGLRLIWTPEKLEVYQKSELAKADALMKLAGGQPMITVDEGRERLELPPMPQAAPPPAEPSPPEAGATPPALPPPTQEAPAETAPLLLAGTLDALKVWQRKSLNRLERGRKALCDFESADIDDDEREAIKHALMHAETAAAVKKAFTPGADLTDEERPLYERLRAILDRVGTQAVRTIESGGVPDVAALADGVAAALLPAITEAVNAQLAALMGEFGVAFDAASVGADIAGAYVSKYMAGIEATTRAALEKAITHYRATPGMTRADLVTQLRGAFGERRAELIAITALTEASNQATESYQQLMTEAGIVMERVWRTGSDERVCPICAPLNGKPESEWKDRFPHGGPAHFRCRCGTTLRVKK